MFNRCSNDLKLAKMNKVILKFILLCFVNSLVHSFQSSSNHQPNSYHKLRNSSSTNLLHQPSQSISSSNNILIHHSPLNSINSNNNLLLTNQSNLANSAKFNLRTGSLNQELTNCKDILLHPPIYEEHCICTNDLLNTIQIDCDELPILYEHSLIINPFISISKYSQRNSGLHLLNAPLFTTTTNDNDHIQISTLDLSDNNLKKIFRLFDGLEWHLEFLNLSHNLLGDNLNPIFSTNEFLKLHNLKSLNLGYNSLRNLDSNLFMGLNQLNVSASS